MDLPGKMFELDKIMKSAHDLAALAWPDETPQEAVSLLIDIQQAACKALGLPDDLALRAGNGMDD
jgi:hypothetical protein